MEKAGGLVTSYNRITIALIIVVHSTKIATHYLLTGRERLVRTVLQGWLCNRGVYLFPYTLLLTLSSKQSYLETWGKGRQSKVIDNIHTVKYGNLYYAFLNCNCTMGNKEYRKDSRTLCRGGSLVRLSCFPKLAKVRGNRNHRLTLRKLDNLPCETFSNKIEYALL